MKSQFKSSHPLSAPESNLLGSISGLQHQIVGRPFRTLRFLRYLSVRIPSFWAPRKNFQWGKNLMSMSSRIIYLASSSQSSMENKLQKYMALPRDRAHSVFPSLDSPIRTRERGRSTVYPTTQRRGSEGTRAFFFSRSTEYSTTTIFTNLLQVGPNPFC